MTVLSPMSLITAGSRRAAVYAFDADTNIPTQEGWMVRSAAPAPEVEPKL